MSQKSKTEYLQEILERYKKAGKEVKRKILDEFCTVCSYHRKYAIKLQNQSPLQETNKQRELMEFGSIKIAFYSLFKRN